MFYDNIKELCARNQVTISYVVKQLGLSTGSPTAWKRGAVPKLDTLQKLSDYFSVTTDQLLNELPPPKLTPGEKGVPIPVLAEVGAGIPQSVIYTFDQDDPESWEEITKKEFHNGRYFALRIHGDSMETLFHHGDVVIVRISPECEDGDYVIALVYDETNGTMEGLCKKLKYKSDGIALLSENPDYPPRLFSKEQIKRGMVRIVGKCVEVRHKIGK